AHVRPSRRLVPRRRVAREGGLEPDPSAARDDPVAPQAPELGDRRDRGGRPASDDDDGRADFRAQHDPATAARNVGARSRRDPTPTILRVRPSAALAAPGRALPRQALPAAEAPLRAPDQARGSAAGSPPRGHRTSGSPRGKSGGSAYTPTRPPSPCPRRSRTGPCPRPRTSRRST